jgi:PPK2 family polyphosphate:nucleotide phosphotransferase
MLCHVVDGSKHVRLNEIDPDDTAGLSREKGEKRLAELGAELGELEDLLFYAGQHALLIVLQGRDTSGKDGAIREILSFSNAQSVRVEPFKVPDEDEAAHDFLWRVHARTPRRGSVTIFNRSHYEDVLVVRVHGLVPEEVWRRRYDHIRHFEDLLLDSSTILLKFCLHISKKEQERRLLDREKETEKAWKLSVGDWKERELWDDYTAAYEDALNRCGTERAPWYVVPADHKWFRNVAVLERIVTALRPYRDDWLDRLAKIGSQAEAELAVYRAGRLK